MTNEIERRYGSRGLHATSVHPGMILTALMQYMGPATVEALKSNEEMYKVIKSPERGAATTVWAAIGQKWEKKGIEYLAECGKTTQGNDNHEILGEGFAGHAYDAEKEARFWKDSLRMVGLTEDE
jgi:NAD(P)-dependent dehydrogenase (short-subunit alcohol dehydrogenase family)